MRILRLWILAALPILVACQSTQKQKDDAAAARAKIDAAHDAKCQSYGAKPGSDAYVNCRVQLAQQQAQADQQLFEMGAKMSGLPVP